MTQSKILNIHSITEPFPTPSGAELAQERTRFIGMNDYWWKIIVPHIEALAKPHLWGDLTDEIEQAIHQLTEEINQVAIYYGARLYLGADTSLPQAITAFVDTVDYDISPTEDPFFDGTDGFNIPVSGIYEINLACRIAHGSAGIRTLFVLVNGATYRALSYDLQNPPGGAYDNTVKLDVKLLLEQGDHVQVLAYQDSDVGGLMMTGLASSTYAEITFLGESPT